MATAVVRFSGICTHIIKPHGPIIDPAFSDEGAHYVLLADVSNPERYACLPELAGLPAHDAKLIVARRSIASSTPLLPAPKHGETVWSYALHDNVSITIEPHAPGGRLEPLKDPTAEWVERIPSLRKLMGLTGVTAGEPMPNGVASRCAANVKIGFGDLTPVDYDERSGDCSGEWSFAAEHVTVAIAAADGTPIQTLVLYVPPADRLPVEPLIQIENVGRDGDDPDDFLFHYYLLFGDRTGQVPKSRRRAEGGTSTGCSNSNYP